jgi:hypothetical protein
MWNTWQLSTLGVLIGWIGLSTGCAAVPTCPPADTVQLPAPQAPPTIPKAAHDEPLTPQSVPSATLALERKVKLQEKRIAELSSQLRLLKRIDLDRNKP